MECPRCRCRLKAHLIPADPVVVAPNASDLLSKRMILPGALEVSTHADTLLSQTILQLENLLQDCRSSQAKHCAFIKHNGFPSRRLPTELWAEIFKLASDYEDNGDGEDDASQDEYSPSEHIFIQGRRTEGPMSISQVCFCSSRLE